MLFACIVFSLAINIFLTLKLAISEKELDRCRLWLEFTIKERDKLQRRLRDAGLLPPARVVGNPEAKNA